MTFDTPLERAILTKRYKRFLADVTTPDGEELTLHCPNTGSMLGCCEPGSHVWYRNSGSLTRKYPCTWELLETRQGEFVCINTGRANSLVAEAIQNRIIVELAGYARLRTEVRYGRENSRIDLCLDDPDEPDRAPCYVEVKSVTLCESDGQGYFPDAVSERGQKHLRELMHIKEQGQRAVLLFCVAHTGIGRVRPADQIDPEYGRLLRLAAERGVEVLAYKAAISAREMRLKSSVPVDLD